MLSGLLSRLINLFTLSYSGTVNMAGAATRLLSSARTKAGSLGLSGTYSYVVSALQEYTETRSGTLSFAAGVVARTLLNFRRTKAGSVTPTGAIKRALIPARTKSGSLLSSGSTIRSPVLARLKSGALTISGAVASAFTGQGNNFADCGNCKALWRFESGALTTDSIGSNNLTNVNSVAESATFKEGSKAADFTRSSSQYFGITDANLDSGFPLKSGESNDNISVCCWYRPETLPSGTDEYALFSKYNWNDDKSSFAVLHRHDDEAIAIQVGYGVGDNYITFPHASALTAGQWYHIGATFNGGTGEYRLRIWDDSASAILGSDLAGTWTDDTIRITTAGVAIGAFDVPAQYMNGILDEVVVFDSILTTDDIDDIRQQVFYCDISRLTDGTLSLIGDYIRDLFLNRQKSGVLNLIGAINRGLNSGRAKSGSLTLSGAYSYALAEAQAITKSGVLSLAGAITRYLVGARTKGGTLSLSGALTRSLLTTRSTLGGTLNLSGATGIGGQANYTATGTLTPAGSLSRSVSYNRTIGGTLTPDGGLDGWISIQELYYGLPNP